MISTPTHQTPVFNLLGTIVDICVCHLSGMIINKIVPMNLRLSLFANFYLCPFNYSTC